MSNSDRFSLSMRLFHWGMAALVVSMLAAGLLMVTSLQPWQYTLLNAHKAFGVIAIILVMARLINRLRHKLPALPSELSDGQKWVAKASHWLLYGLLFAMPLSGYLMQYFAGRPVAVFDWFRLPAALQVDIYNYALFRELHGWLAIALIGVIALHVGAALHHHFVRKDNVLKSML
ncbi:MULTISPECIES: cytochrome b [unclassified Arsukibacterium]|uniref:cytochrome b n=1 Tax=unclassified Arsukibacterium TaxID=2635278 RepID=UPI000C48BA4D|nr:MULTISPECIES: cytochrome b [unclassified Arsukibacterium]MAA95747.1 cytochrome B [Rheinheimera sp.]MBM33595.1 cytochrome B [Rheinheimera sp.]HAW92821.1 cytochrome B [Candidatus Azambacteria bacterium]